MSPSNVKTTAGSSTPHSGYEKPRQSESTTDLLLQLSLLNAEVQRHRESSTSSSQLTDSSNYYVDNSPATVTYDSSQDYARVDTSPSYDSGSSSYDSGSSFSGGDSGSF